MSLETLPEEMIIHILLYLHPVDRLNLGKTSKLFGRISQDRSVLKKLDISHDYTFKTVHWKQITRQACAHFVKILNLNGITWLSNSELTSGLGRMVNLEQLFLLDTNLSNIDLRMVVKTTSKIKKLAISLKPDNSGAISHEYIQLPLTHLMVTYNGYGVQSLARLLTQFKTLEELWLIEPMIPFRYEIIHDRDWINSSLTQIPKVSKRIVLGRQYCAPSDDSDLISNLQVQDGNWQYLEQINEGSLFYVVENFENKDARLPGLNMQNEFEVNLERIQTDLLMTHIICASDKRDMILNNLPYSEMYFTCMNMVSYTGGIDLPDVFEPELAMEIFEKFLFAPNLTKLNRLCCETTPFWEQYPQILRHVDLFKRRRIGVLQNISGENSRFARFTKHTPYMKDFELIDNDERPLRDSMWTPECLKYISNWRELNKLVISSTNLQNGKFLIEIAMHCTKLTVLKIKDDTVKDITTDLCKALVYCKNLKDFRFERKGGILIDQLFGALAQCTALERTFIQCRFVTKLSKEPIERTINSCVKLYFLFIHILELTDSVCKKVNRDLCKLRKLPFLAKIVGQNFRMENIRYRDVSIFHIQDIMTHTNYPYFEFMKNF